MFTESLTKRIFEGIAVVAVALFGFAGRVDAQYFGRNKIQYQQFHFRVIKTKNIDVYHYPPVTEAADDAAAMAERWYQRFALVFDYQIPDRQPLILYANHPDFAQTNAIPGRISQGTGGVTEGLKRRVVLPLTDCYAEDNHVIGHELVHAFQYSIAESSKGKGERGQINAPLWFIEGMAEFLSLGHSYTLTSVYLRDAVLRNDIPTLGHMSNGGKYFPYRWGHAFWDYVTLKYGEDMPSVLYRAALRGDWKNAIQKTFGFSDDSLSVLWQQYIRDTYKPQIAGRTSPDSLGRPLQKSQPGIILAPSISPDGRYVAYIGQRDVFTLDLFLADVATGKVVAKLASSGTDAHFDAIQFTNSAGTWSPDGKQLAFVVVKDGKNQISITNIASREIERTFGLDSVGAIYQLAWSPDGQRLAISGSHGGIDDLYIYNLSTGQSKQITHDRYAQLQPTWSPDGKSVAFMTDEGAPTNLSLYYFRKMQIGILNLATDSLRYVDMSQDASHSNPLYDQKGRLLFVADPDGYPNIYRYDFSTGAFEQLTNVATGVSGLTSLSPSMSIASKTGLVACTVFDSAGYKLRLLNTENRTTQPSASQPVALSASTDSIPDYAVNTPDSVVDIDSLLDAPSFGLEDSTQFTSSRYHPHLGLIYAGESVAAIAANQFGTYVGGGVSLLYSDLLGNRQLGVTVQANGGIKDVGGEVLYQNLSHRLNWGLSVGHIPYLTAYILNGIDTAVVNGQVTQVYRQDLIKERVFDDRLSFVTNYPLSPNRRFEFSAGYAHVSYSAERQTVLSQGNYILGTNTTSLPAPSPLDLGLTSIAYVGDYSFFGFTSPARGSRYRFEVDPTFGSLNYLTVVADYRHYFFANPVTFAFRGLHIGRYMGDSNSDRLSPLYLGFETLVRGYPINSISLSECTDPNCMVYQRLIGSRLGVFNAEIRLPVLGSSEYGLVNWPYLPTELVAFLDGGVAWSAGDPPKFKLTERSDQRIPVFSAGGAVRINFFGYLVGQFYLAFPFQRPDKTVQLGFVVSPGW